MTGSNNFSNPSTMQDNMSKSRKIHQQMMNKKNRWRPSELELALLKLHFQKNQYPSKEEKEGIIHTLERQFGTKVHIDQLSRWFQHEREKAMARNSKIVCKNTYRKFCKEELDYLQESFAKNNYPKMDEMIAMAKKLDVNLSKIENWYKHNRRTLAKRGAFSLKTKKYFKKEELSYLVEMFENHPRPTKEQFFEIAEKLGCTESQIKNWYSNKRKKLKLIAKKQGYESTDTSYSTDQSLFSKASLYSEPASIPLQIPIINSTLPLQHTEIIPKITEPQQLVSAPFIINNQISGPQQAQPFYSGYTSGGIPILVVPTTVSNSSSMIVNTNIINNPNQNTIPVFNNELNLNAKELKSPHILQELKSSAIATTESERSRLMTPPSIISPFSQSNTVGAFPQKVFFPSPSIIPINTPSTPSSIDTIQNPWYKPIQLQKPELEFAKKIQPNMGILSSPLTMGPTLSPKLDINRGLGTLGNLAGNLIPLSAANGISIIPAINNFPGQTNIGLTATESHIKPINTLSQMAPSTISPQKPVQVQYQTSLYLPFSNNNIYNQYPPVMLQQGPELYLHGPAQPQMHMNTFIPAGSVASSQQK